MLWHNRSLFITCEGGEGVGKTTLISRLKRELLSRGYEVVVTREPGGSKLGEYIRQWLLNRDFNISIGNKAELLLFLAARAQHIEELIKPALAEGKIVLCDRFNDSTVAYQGVARGLGREPVQDLCELVCDHVTPDLTFFIDVDPKVGIARTKRSHKENAKAGEVDRIEAEKLEFHQKVRGGLQELAKLYPDRIYTIDGAGSINSVFHAALKQIEKKLALRVT
jgi:dTMP kinase